MKRTVITYYETDSEFNNSHKVVDSSRMSALESMITKNDHNIANNEQQLNDAVIALKNELKTLTGRLDDIDTHNKNNAQIVDTIENQILDVKQHLAQITTPVVRPDTPATWTLVDEDYFRIYPIGTPVVENVPYSKDYEIKYMKGTKFYRTTTANDIADMSFTNTGGKLSIVTHTAISYLYIYKVQRV